MSSYILTIKCPDRVGIVAAVTGFLADHQGWITEAHHHSDPGSGCFFMRQEIRADSLQFGIDDFRQRFSVIADRYEMEWTISDSARRKRVVLLVSKQDHCLSDILHRYRNGEYHIEIPCVISNHEALREIVEWHDLPYHHIPVPRDNKATAFAELEALLSRYDAEVIVLARYMQIIPPNLCRAYANRVINIHHSCLPSFVGAKPYHQAYERGVKLIGATCHYVTEELDAGPIIEQDILRVDHSHTASDLVRQGRDVEKMALARGLRYHLEDRVLVHGNKTVVFT